MNIEGNPKIGLITDMEMIFSREDKLNEKTKGQDMYKIYCIKKTLNSHALHAYTDMIDVAESKSKLDSEVIFIDPAKITFAVAEKIMQKPPCETYKDGRCIDSYWEITPAYFDALKNSCALVPASDGGLAQKYMDEAEKIKIARALKLIFAAGTLALNAAHIIIRSGSKLYIFNDNSFILQKDNQFLINEW